MHWAEGWTPGGQCDFWRSSGIVTLGAVYLDFAMLTERSRRRKVVPMVGGRIEAGGADAGGLRCSRAHSSRGGAPALKLRRLEACTGGGGASRRPRGICYWVPEWT